MGSKAYAQTHKNQTKKKIKKQKNAFCITFIIHSICVLAIELWEEGKHYELKAGASSFVPVTVEIKFLNRNGARSEQRRFS